MMDVAGPQTWSILRSKWVMVRRKHSQGAVSMAMKRKSLEIEEPGCILAFCHFIDLQ